MKVTLPELLWYGNTTVDISFPEDWDVEICPMQGAEKPPISTDDIDAAVKSPIGSPPLKELARGKKRAVVIFDDMTRPTPAADIAPIVIEDLLAGGMDEDDITFVCALGNHGALTNHDLRKKLGTNIIERFRVYNHNAYEHCIEVGTTSLGTKVHINREVMEADLKIGIGCVTAHAQTGFSGGGKIILPGVSHYDTAAHYHNEVYAMDPGSCGLGNYDNNILRKNIEEAARLAGLDFKIDVLFNERGLVTDVFAGDFVEAHKNAVEVAKPHYAADPKPVNKNVVVANAFAKANEMAIAILCGVLGLGNLTGTVVVIANAPEGQVTHYLMRSFGRDYGGLSHPPGRLIPSINLIVVAPYLDRTFGDWVGNPELITWTKSWDEALERLTEIHGPGTSVGVVPNATMMYYSS